jgi:hypothetical protein
VLIEACDEWQDSDRRPCPKPRCRCSTARPPPSRPTHPARNTTRTRIAATALLHSLAEPHTTSCTTPRDAISPGAGELVNGAATYPLMMVSRAGHHCHRHSQGRWPASLLEPRWRDRFQDGGPSETRGGMCRPPTSDHRSPVHVIRLKATARRIFPSSARRLAARAERSSFSCRKRVRSLP